MSKLRRRSRAGQRGYTLVELMMALALLTVGILGVIAMQKVTVSANTQSKNVAIAERLAQAWAGQLEMDATTWRGTLGGFLNADGVWERPPAARGFGAAFDAFGNALSDTPTELAKARFCSHVRLTPLYPVGGGGSNGMLRAEIRVFWLRDGESMPNALLPTPADGLCAAGQTAVQAAAIGLSTDHYHFVYQTVGVRQHFQI